MVTNVLSPGGAGRTRSTLLHAAWNVVGGRSQLAVMVSATTVILPGLLLLFRAAGRA